MTKKPVKAKPVDDPEEADSEHEDAAEAAAPRPAPAAVSTPAKASCLTFVFLVLAVLISMFIWLVRGGSVWEGLPWYWFVTVIVLVFVIPIVVYRAVALWMYDEISRFPEIAAAWRAGIVALQQHGIAIDSAPLFLIVGTGNDKLRRNFMSAAEGDFFIDGAAETSAPLHWYVNSDGIFLFLDDASWMNAAVTFYEVQAAALKSGHRLPAAASAASGGGRKVARVMGTLIPDVRLQVQPQPPRHAETPSDAGRAAEGRNPSVSGPQEHGAGADYGPNHGEPIGDRYVGTIVPGQVGPPLSSPAGSPAAHASAAWSSSVVAKRVSIRLTSQQSSRQLQRLENVCGLLRKYRHPVCPANGILTLLPFEMLRAADQDIAELERAISADLSTIYRELQLRCPVTDVVVGMEQERGFRELIRRIGRDGALKQRFGQRFDIRSHATIDELRKFTSHVCGAFEDWVYTLFRDEEALSHPGNTSLYALLCKVRRTLKTRLGDILGNGFGCDRQGEKMPILFSGCYFAATGPKADRQAFVHGLLSKLYDEQEEVEWTADAVRDSRRRGWLALVGWAVCGAILFAVASRFAWEQLSK